METIVFLIAICIIIALVYYLNRRNKVSALSNKTYYPINSAVTMMKEEAIEFNSKMKELNNIPEIQVQLSLKNGEKAYLQEQAQLYEQRSQSVYHRGGVGFRVAKGVYVGGSKGYSTTHPEMRLIDNGMLYFTSKRIIFNGTNTLKEYPIHKIVSLDTKQDGVWLSLEGKEKKQLYAGMKNPLIWMMVLHAQKNLDAGLEIPSFEISIEN